MMTDSITKEFVASVIESASMIELNVNKRRLKYTCDNVEYIINILMSHHKRSTGDDTYVIVGHNTMTIPGIVHLEYLVDYSVDPFTDTTFQIDSYKLNVNALVSDAELEHHVMMIKLQLPNREVWP